MPGAGTAPRRRSGLLLQGHGEMDLCPGEGIKPHFYYYWSKEFMEARKERLARDAVPGDSRLHAGFHGVAHF